MESFKKRRCAKRHSLLPNVPHLLLPVIFLPPSEIIPCHYYAVILTPLVVYSNFGYYVGQLMHVAKKMNTPKDKNYCL